jgi:hypothetical protein
MDEMLFLRRLEALASECEFRGDYVSAAHLQLVLDRILDGDSPSSPCLLNRPFIQELQ